MIQAKKQAPKVVLITGAARRIGAAIANYLHQMQFKVAIHYHQSGEEASHLAQKLNRIRPNSAHVFQQDLNQLNQNSRLIDDVIQWAGRLDVLVNNASLFIRNDFEAFNENDWLVQFKVNVQAPFLLSQLAFPYLSRQQGCIINITDTHALHPIKGYAVYCQTKAALLAQTKALAKEFAPAIRVNAVAPGAIAWPEQDNCLNEAVKNQIIESTPLKRHGEPIHIAQAVFALVQNEFITGQVLAVDGGRVG